MNSNFYEALYFAYKITDVHPEDIKDNERSEMLCYARQLAVCRLKYKHNYSYRVIASFFGHYSLSALSYMVKKGQNKYWDIIHNG